MSRASQIQTIADFSEQWRRFPTNEDYFSSLEFFQDSLGSLIDVGDFDGKVVADLGSGTGRFTKLLCLAGARHVFSIEPADSMDIVRANTREFGARITYLNTAGDSIELREQLDFAISMGVISYIPDPRATFAAVWRALKPGGRFAVCLMAREGNEAYLRIFGPIRRVTVQLPDRLLLWLCKVLLVMTDAFGLACRYLRLPLRSYMTEVFGKLSREKRTLIIYDQLNPSFARYYSGAELETAFTSTGFEDVQIEHRHGYSWVASGLRPLNEKSGSAHGA